MTTFQAFRVEMTGDQPVRSVQTVTLEQLPPGEVTVRVHYSSLNYKDALSASGNRGVTKNYPHTPGIDAAGVVTSSSDDRFNEGDEVIVTSYDLGMNTPGGFGEFIRVPAAWVVPLPTGLSLREAMMLGTAGLTAGLCVDALEHHSLVPNGSPVVVTGASGGVGSLAVALLAKLGYEVVASTGKETAHDYLRALGASHIIDRQALSETTKKPLLAASYAAAVDTVGGVTLANLIKQLEHGGAVAACGLVGGAELSLTVYPFILRGVSLLGIDSGACPFAKRERVWRKLAGDWKLDKLEEMTTEIDLAGLDEAVARILSGGVQGRTLVKL